MFSIFMKNGNFVECGINEDEFARTGHGVGSTDNNGLVGNGYSITLQEGSVQTLTKG